MNGLKVVPMWLAVSIALVTFANALPIDTEDVDPPHHAADVEQDCDTDKNCHESVQRLQPQIASVG
jgi:hypothetical protein